MNRSKHRSRRSPTLAVGLATATLTAALTGCTQPVQGDMMTPDEAQMKLIRLMERIQVEIGGEWDVQDDPSPLSCDIRGGGEGVQFSVSRFGPSPGTMDDAKAATDTVTEILTGEGYEVGESGLFGKAGYELTVTNNRGSNILFGANDVATDLAGGSDCVPGDIDQILEDLEQQGL